MTLLQEKGGSIHDEVVEQGQMKMRWAGAPNVDRRGRLSYRGGGALGGGARRDRRGACPTEEEVRWADSLTGRRRGTVIPAGIEMRWAGAPNGTGGAPVLPWE
jgi:hypothetical protein